MPPPTHEITINQHEQAACCDQHSAVVATCNCGWAFNKDKSPGPTLNQVYGAINGHKIDVLAAAAGIGFETKFHQPKQMFAGSDRG